jgi:SAM-dependent methyltransferase
VPEFDLIAPVYDETRGPPPAVELRGILDALEGCRRVLEAGVGTGRYASRLLAAGHEVTGVDISREMMRHARQKGVHRLLLGDVHRLPFRDASFDASLMVHVLQLLPDPALPLRELGRVSTQAVVALLPDHSEQGAWMDGRGRKFRERYREVAAELGYDLPARAPRFWENTEKVVQLVKPRSLTEIEFSVPRDPARRERWLRDARTFGGMIHIPPEVHEKIVARLREEFRAQEPSSAERKRRVRVATWDPAELRRILAPGVPPA